MTKHTIFVFRLQVHTRAPALLHLGVHLRMLQAPDIRNCDVATSKYAMQLAADFSFSEALAKCAVIV